jgi:hypothetical protein
MDLICLPVSDNNFDAVLVTFFEQLVALVHFHAGNILAVDLQNLVTKLDSSQGGRRVFGDEADKETLVDCSKPQTDLALSVFAQYQLQ